MRRLKWLGVAVVLLALAVGLAAWWMAPRKATVVSPSGYTVTLEGYQFATNRVEYANPNIPALLKLLPNKLQPIGVYRTRVGVGVRPEFPGERRLSAAFNVRLPSRVQGWVGRLVVADENGNEFDAGGQHAVNFGNNPSFEVYVARAFPRRGEKLKLRLKSNAETVAEFEIPNPARGKYPQWVAESLPVRAEAGDLEVTLVEFVSEQTKEFTGGKHPNTSFVFELRQGGLVTTNWVPLGVEFSDATGNRWKSFWRGEGDFEGGKLKVKTGGALWEGEDAWKVKVEFRQSAGFDEGDLLRMEGLEVPTRAGFVQQEMSHEQEDGRVELIGLFGPNADRDKAQDVFLNINPRPDAVTLALKLSLVEFDRSFSPVAILDEEGRRQEVVAVDRGPTRPEDERYVPLQVYFKPMAGVKKVTMVYALPKDRTVEFLAKPIFKVMSDEGF